MSAAQGALRQTGGVVVGKVVDRAVGAGEVVRVGVSPLATPSTRYIILY